MNKLISIEVVSDVVCPWCYIGTLRLRRAIEKAGDASGFQVRYRPFELNPNLPVGGEDHLDHLSRKFGSRSAVQAMHQKLTDLAHGEGLVFRFDKVKRIPNTFKAHQLIWLAEKHGVQEGVARDLYRAYFEQGIDIGDSGELEKIAARHGIPPTEVQSLWNDKLGKGEVSLMEQESVSLGISGVPAFIIQNKWLVRGAQPPETFLDIFSGISREGDPSPKDMRAVN